MASKRAERFERTASSQGELQIANSSFGPCPLQAADGSLGGLAESHRRVDDEMIEMPIVVEVHGQDMCMTVTISERLAMIVLTGQFRTMNAMSLRQASDYRTMQQFGLRQCPAAWRQRGSITARCCQRQ